MKQAIHRSVLREWGFYIKKIEAKSLFRLVVQLKEELEVSGSDEELEEEDEATLKEGETSGSELGQVEENDVSHSCLFPFCCVVRILTFITFCSLTQPYSLLHRWSNRDGFLIY